MNTKETCYKRASDKIELSDYPAYDIKPDWEKETILRAINKRRRKRGLEPL